MGIVVVAATMALGLVPPAGAVAAVAMTPAAVVAPTFLTSHFAVRGIDPSTRPFTVSSPLPLVDTGPHDADGVRMFVVNGVLHNHPVAQAQYGLWLVDSFRQSGDRTYLDRAVAQAQRIISRRVESGGAWFFPYDFSFTLHQDPTKGVERAPWYSAMAQGEALSLFVRLDDVTGDPAYRAAADATFRSFLARPSATRPWVAHVDASRNLWLDEFPHYPASGSDFTMNGHMFAAFGLYDYYRLTQDPAALQLWDGALRTVAVVLPARIRNPGWISNYCVAHGHPSARYHADHIDQLIRLHAMTGSPVFARLADLLADDYPAPREPGTLIVTKGVRSAYTFGAGGVVLRIVTRVVPRTVQVPYDLRQRIRGRGVYYHVTSGVWAGRWIAEQPRVAVARAVVGQEHYLLTRRLVLPAGTATGLVVSASGSSSVLRTVLPRATRYIVDARGWVRGVASVHVTSGALAGSWVPVAAGTFL